MTISTAFPIHSREVLWLRIDLVATLDVAGIDQWNQRLIDYFREQILAVGVSPTRIAVIPIGRNLTAADGGLVMGWLAAQPEVGQVRIEHGCADPQLHFDFSAEGPG